MPEPHSLGDRDWKLLLQRIDDEKCTPIIGADVFASLLPPFATLAQSWAHENDYPFADPTDIARVAQYLAVNFDPLYPKEELQRAFAEHPSPPDDPQLPHHILASLPFPIYITTSYDDLLFKALQDQRKEPKVEICRWNELLQNSHPSLLEAGFEPTVATPIVYHLFGHHTIPESLVLAEDDYYDFLVNISSGEFNIPSRIQRALASTSLLFLGYTPTALDFRILFRGLVAASESALRRINVTVQLPPVPEGTPDHIQDKIQNYLNEYFDQADSRMRVYWGEAPTFLQELNQRTQNITPPPPPPEASNTYFYDPMKLLDTMMDAFSLEDMRTLAFELRVDYDRLPPAKDLFAREFIVYMQRTQRLPELITRCRELRPTREW
ncbi:MAG TPA: SIR2 family protein [Anaerolineae bacterium]|nr:SIR2 family protein [Anaerolineae bacterium]